MNKIIFFIDGFNLYHAIDSENKYHKYKWLNIANLAKCYVKKKDTIVDIYYFTALATWSLPKVQRHEMLIKALKYTGIHIVYGQFRRKDRTCHICKKSYKTFEEKQTDVNIAIYLLRLAIEERYDTAIIVSGDSDLIPSIEATKNIFPAKNIGIVIPIGRRAELLKNTCDFHYKMKEKHLKTSIFDRVVKIGNNKKLICPQGWL